MILTCPNCQTRYVVDPNKLGPSGRSVRCDSCQHSWFQSGEVTPLPPPENTYPISDDLPDVVTEDDLEDMFSSISHQVGEGRRDLRDALRTYSDQDGRVGERKFSLDRFHFSKYVPGFVYAIFGTLNRWKYTVLAWGFFFAVVIGGAQTLYLKRQSLVNFWPDILPLYDKLGIPVQPPNFGLDIPEVKAARDPQTQAVILEGVVVNISAVPREVPPLQISVRNAMGDTLRNWPLSRKVTILQPAERFPFKTELTDIPNEGTLLAVTFVTK
ncbi:MAG: zinc-ribbon domain-containing protein [Candidatus Symbiobacter sp.]|nr:zinc-ribbon domain-containing protein [Candidatus Symbiobacter sp.]